MNKCSPFSGVTWCAIYSSSTANTQLVEPINALYPVTPKKYVKQLMLHFLQFTFGMGFVAETDFALSNSGKIDEAQTNRIRLSR
jgi:hypothetical protein